jgi:2-oxoisovalerate dehydrogenase E1 component
MGVYWAKMACKGIEDQVEIIDLRSLNPIDYSIIQKSVEKTNRCLVITEEPTSNGFAQALAGWVAENCFESLEAAPKVIGSQVTPAIPLNSTLEQAYLPKIEKIRETIEQMLNY